jgi:carbon monoxide dehydrogenase subunit G
VGLGKEAIMRIENTITIDREPETVWAYLADLEHIPEWNPAIVATRKVTRGPVGVGTVYEQERIEPEPGTESIEVTRYEPGRRLDLHGTFGPFLAELRYAIEDLGDACRLTNVAELEARGALRLFQPIAARRIREAIADNLRALKHRLEAA